LGTSVISGTATMEVELTGRQTKFSHIAQSWKARSSPRSLTGSIKDFSYLIMKITFVLVIFIFLINALLKAKHFGIVFVFGRAGRGAHTRVVADDYRVGIYPKAA